MSEFKTFSIPDMHEGKFIRKMKNLSNKADKLGLNFGFEKVGSPVMREHKTENGDIFYYSEQNYQVWGLSPNIDGWDFLGRIEKLPTGENFIWSHSDRNLSAFHHVELTCEHCKVNRTRTVHFLVGSADGDVKMVGRNCLANYTGLPSADKVAKFYSFVDDSDFYPTDEDFERIPRGESWYDAEFLLALAVDIASKNGFVSGAKSDETGQVSTKNLVIEAMVNGDLPTENAEFEAKKIRAFLSEILGDGTGLWGYEWDMAQVVRMSHVKYQHIGYLVSAVSMYARKLEDFLQKQNTPESNWVGTVGAKIEGIEVEVVFTHCFETYYNLGEIIKMVDGAGNVIVWMTNAHRSKYNDIKAGDTLTIVSATVKSHETYEGEKQTKINRPKLDLTGAK